MTTYSIAQARDQFAALIRQVERRHEAVLVTRRGTPVAVILSQEEYERLLRNRDEQDFWQAYQSWRKDWQLEDSDNGDVFIDVRDPSPGRENIL